MKIELTKEESEEYFFNAMCNGLGYIASYGLELEIDDTYQKVKKRLINEGSKSLCYEDILMEVLRSGGTLTLIDYENDDERFSITLSDVHNRVQTTIVSHLMDMVNGQDDAITADVILQTVFLGEVIYG